LLDLVTSPTTSSQMSFLLPSYIQNFLRIILLVVRDRRNTGMKEVKVPYLGVFFFLGL
jgi:hypothetical protein